MLTLSLNLLSLYSASLYTHRVEHDYYNISRLAGSTYKH